MENILRRKTASVQKISTSSKIFGVGAGMFVTTIAMTALGGTYGAVLAAGISGVSFALGIVAFKNEQRAKRA